MRIEVDITKLLKNFDKDFARPVENHVNSSIESTAIATGNWMRRNAPWSDQTGDARRSTVSYVEGKGLMKSIVMGIGMWYGRFLELANGGRFRIVEPALYYAIDTFKNFLQKRIK